MLTEFHPHGETLYRRSCDCEGCTNHVLVDKWPSGAISGGDYLRAVGPRVKNTRMSYDVCRPCAAAGKLPPLAENPQPFPLALA